MKNKTGLIIGAIIVLVIGILAFVYAPNKQSTQTKTQQKLPANNNAPKAVTPAQNVSNTPTEDPQDVVAGLYKNPIQNTSTQEGFVVTNSLVENNADKTGKVVDDHLELSLKNTAGKDLTDFEVHYTITDTVTGQKEGYYKKLTGFVLKSGETRDIHFDGGTDAGHFSVNKNSLYYKSPNKMTFDVVVSTGGYKIQTVQISKDAGGAELND